MQQKETSAAQSRAGGFDHGQRGRHGHRSVECIAAPGENFLTRLAGERIGARDGALVRNRGYASGSLRRRRMTRPQVRDGRCSRVIGERRR